MPAGTIAALSSSDSAAHVVRTTVTGGAARTTVTGGAARTYRAGGRGNSSAADLVFTADPIAIAGRRAARGPAPSVKLCGFFATDVSAAGLLRAVRGGDGVVAAAILFEPLSPGVAQRAGSRGAVSAAASGGVSPSAATIAAGLGAAAMMSLPVVRLPRSREDRTYPPRRRRAGGFRYSRFLPFLPVLGGGVEGASCVAGRTPR